MGTEIPVSILAALIIPLTSLEVALASELRTNLCLDAERANMV